MTKSIDVKVHKLDPCFQPLTKVLDFGSKLAQELLLDNLHGDISFLGDITHFLQGGFLSQLRSRLMSQRPEFW